MENQNITKQINPKNHNQITILIGASSINTAMSIPIKEIAQTNTKPFSDSVIYLDRN